MKLFVLSVENHLLFPEGADRVGYSEWTMPRGFVILAEEAGEARMLASLAEGGGVWWLDPKSTTCTEVEVGGSPRIVLANEPTG